MGGPRIHRLPVFLAARLVAAAGIAAYTSGSGSTQGNTPNQGPELSTITVGTLDTSDAMEVWLAQPDGCFMQEGQNQVAAPDPALARKLLPKFLKTLTSQIANIMAIQTFNTMLTFNTVLSVTRLQRVAHRNGAVRRALEELQRRVDDRAAVFGGMTT